MSFRNNLQHLRATRNMTQEQLAMLVGVSRQSVTKWESERSYPEMDKLQKICQIFDCTLDELVSGNLTGREVESATLIPDGPVQDVCGYDEHMRLHALHIASGVFSIIFGIALMLPLQALFGTNESTPITALVIAPMMAGIAIGLFLIIPNAIAHKAFVHTHPYIEDFYTTAQKHKASKQMGYGIATGVAFILIGIIISVAIESSSDFSTGDKNGVMGAATLIALIAVAVWMFVYFSMMKERTNVAEYNKDASVELDEEEIRKLDLNDTDTQTLIEHRRLDRKISSICAIIMLIATVVALTWLFAIDFERHLFWTPWVIGGICCAITDIITNLRHEQA